MMNSIQDSIIETGNFYLRPFNINDLDLLIDIYSDQDVIKFFGETTTEQVRKILNRYITRYNELNISKFAVFTKDNNKFVGGCGFDILHDPDNNRNPLGSRSNVHNILNGDLELGYWFYKQYWGKGYATILAYEVIQYAFDKFPHLDRIVAVTDLNNLASQKVLTKLGFEFVKDVESKEYGKEKFFVLYKTSLA